MDFDPEREDSFAPREEGTWLGSDWIRFTAA